MYMYSDALVGSSFHHALAGTPLFQTSTVAACNKSEALAGYAKQAGNHDLRKMADRIQARAIRRCGEFLREIPKASGARTDIKPTDGTVSRLTRLEAATDAGLSERQRVTAVRVANVPAPAQPHAVGDRPPPAGQRQKEEATDPRLGGTHGPRRNQPRRRRIRQLPGKSSCRQWPWRKCQRSFARSGSTPCRTGRAKLLR